MAVWQAISQALNRVGNKAVGLFDLIGQASRTNPNSREAAFSMAAVALAAKLAKADGIVTTAEVESFWRRFDVPPEGHKAIRRLYELAQRDVAGYQSYAHQIMRLFPDDPVIREDLLDVLFAIAASDKVIHEAELAFLERVGRIFAIDGADFARIKARHVAPEKDPYAVLGLDPDTPFSEVRRQYRLLAVEHHPDRLMARGLPPEFVRVASDRLAAINAAYEAIERSNQSSAAKAPT